MFLGSLLYYKVFLFTSWPDIVQIKSLLWRPQLSATESWRTHPTCDDNDNDDDENDNDDDNDDNDNDNDNDNNDD